jgi:acetoin utilization deacetylase AcuC-like enzyme
MITHEHLASAIDAIAAVDPQTGFGLKTLFEAARITAPAVKNSRDHTSGAGSFPYYFDGQRVEIPKTAFVAHGIPTLEQSLVLKWGTFREKQTRAAAWVSGNVRQLARDIRQAGAATLVKHELQRLPEWPPDLDTPLGMPDPGGPEPHFCGHLASGQAARFIPLPLTRETLTQVAGHTFEFFDVRFMLNSWIDGTLPWIYACIARKQILGLVKLQLHRQAVNTGLEVRYIARRMPGYDDTEAPPKGVGTFLMAGTWMVWQAFHPEARHIFLDGEVGAHQFYLDCGFRKQGLCRFVLETPRGYLLSVIADMADDARPPAGQVQPRLEGLIGAAIKALSKRRARHRQTDLAFIRRCLMSRHQPYPATTALALLLKHQPRIPEATALIDYATRTCRVRIAGEKPDAQTTILVVDDPRFALHLHHIFHLESPKRFEAFQRALAHPSVAGRWHSLMIEPAEREQLLWVHTAAYLERLEKTSGRQLVSLDMDTQTTERSWEVACLAVGGVFRLMDGICDGRALRGVAAVRPPGHHAEPDRAMGFCLLNNVALAARYLQRTHGVGRIMIIDLDAHHGNGTQTVFYEDASVLYVSTHGFPAYPGTGNFGEIGRGPGKGFTVNIPFAKGAGDRDFICATHRVIAPLAHQYRPDFILVSLGFDLYRHDRLGGMSVSPEGYGTLTAMLLQIAERECAGRIAFILEGGYSVKGIEDCGLRFLQHLCAVDRGNRNPSEPWNPKSIFTPSAVSKVIEVQKPFWPRLA